MIQNITPAERVSAVQEYYFSRKLKEVAKLNAEGQDIISLSAHHGNTRTATGHGPFLQTMVQC